jgi:hypothetical protein
MQSKAKRPVVLIFIIYFTALTSVTSLLVSIGPVFNGVANQAANQPAFYLGLLYIVTGIGGLVAIVGLWMYRSWANLLIRIFCLVSIVLGLLALSKNTSGTNLLMQIFTIGLNIWIIWYLMRPQTKALFSRGKK